MADLDALIAQLQVRIADPDRRVDVRPTRFEPVTDVSTLLSMVGGLGSQLRRLVDANQAGRPIDPDILARTDAMAASAMPPADVPRRDPATASEVEAAERDLGVVLPPAMRRVYLEVADGGFGPGSGLLPIAEIVAAYRDCRTDPPMAPAGAEWPDGLLPIIRHDIDYDAIEASTGRIIEWDPESLTERSGLPGWRRTFSELSPSFEEWLQAWVDAPTLDERMAEQTRLATIQQARESRAMIAAMTPEQRAAMGLPEVGWEEIVWGGIGLDEDG